MIDARDAEAFLAHQRFAVVGASDKPDSFGRTILHELATRGKDVVAVHPGAATVDDRPCYPDLASVPGELDGVIVMVNRDKAADVVRACIDRGVPRVWLFKGVGGSGAVSDEAMALCHEHGIDVVAGACPLMFADPVGWFHRVHRGARRLNGSLSRA
ncbi:MAG TPA: CoA-binding protein [Acidimicrobiales bacterium]|nr:CoA-binding protein [Acidimicrobiales bacterium]